MKNLTIISVFVIFAIFLTGCGVIEGSGNVVEETRQVSGFDQIELWGIGDVIVTQGEQESLRVEAEDNLMQYLRTEVSGGKLVIDFNTPPGVSVWPKKPVRFYVTVKEIKGLTLNGSGNFTAADLKTDELTLKLTGSGDMDIDSIAAETLRNKITGSGSMTVASLDAGMVDSHIDGSGSCSLAGLVDEQTVRIDGSGDYEASDLESLSASVKVMGSGDAQVWASENMDVSITGSGNVNYTGEPELMTNLLGSGDLNYAGKP